MEDGPRQGGHPAAIAKLPSLVEETPVLTETNASATGANGKLRAPPPEQFFMTLRDVGLWVRSARTDAAVARDAAARDVAQAFEALYRADPDPYGAVDPRYRYQARKYATLLSYLPARHYRHVLE